MSSLRKREYALFLELINMQILVNSDILLEKERCRPHSSYNKATHTCEYARFFFFKKLFKFLFFIENIFNILQHDKILKQKPWASSLMAKRLCISGCIQNKVV